MDIIGALTSQLGIPGDQAQALAGGVLGAVQSQVKSQLGETHASQLAAAVPELGGWQDAAQKLLATKSSGGLGDALGGLLGGGAKSGLGDALGGLAGGLTGGGGGLGGALGGLVSGQGGALAGALGGLLGGGPETQALVAVATKLGLDPGKVQAIAPIAVEFLKSRVSPDLLGAITKVVPFLGATGGGGLAGALGGLFGR